LSAYRSVFYRIERSVSQDDALNGWYLSELEHRGFPWKPAAEKKWHAGTDPVLNLLKALRDTDVHEKDIVLRNDATVHLATIELRVDVGGPSSKPAAPPQEAAPGPRPPYVELRWRFDELPHLEVIPECEDALRKVEELVAACESKNIT
jgi:hypothetical protein